MLNHCPACNQETSDQGSSGYCLHCGWEFIRFSQPFPEGEEMLRKRLETAQKFIRFLQEGGNELTATREENGRLKSALEESGNEVQRLKTELETAQENNQDLENQLDKAFRDQNFIAANEQYEGRRTRIEFGVNANGEIMLSSRDSLPTVPTLMLVVKKGDIPVASPAFGEDGTYAAILQGKRWKPAANGSFNFSSDHLKQIFPKMEGAYTFALYAFSPEYKLVRMGNSQDVSSVTLNLSN